MSGPSLIQNCLKFNSTDLCVLYRWDVLTGVYMVWEGGVGGKIILSNKYIYSFVVFKGVYDTSCVIANETAGFSF